MQRQEGIDHAYRAEDLTELNRILGQQYHVVVGNPPYITVKDRALKQAYRSRYSTCHQEYSLAVPFTERFFELAIYGHDGQPAGYVGMIAANSFMKREFGKKLIEEFFPRADLTHVIDTSGAYIPGHGTPTVILFGRDRLPLGQTVRAVLGIRGEPSTPATPAQGQVWRSIVELLDSTGVQNDFISVTDVPRDIFSRHPWSIGGGGATELKQLIDFASQSSLGTVTKSIGITSFTLEDDVYIMQSDAARRLGLLQSDIRPMVVGDAIRDWALYPSDPAIFPYNANFTSLAEDRSRQLFKHLSRYRTCLENNKMFAGKPRSKLGLNGVNTGG